MTPFKPYGRIRPADRDAAQLADQLNLLANMTGRLDRASRAELRQVVRDMRNRCGDQPPAAPTDMLA